MKEMKISAIREGTVIDHIPPKNAFKVAELLDLREYSNIVSVATNLPSKKMGLKGMVKIGGRTLTESELSKIALLAPKATVSVIKEYNVKKKQKLKLPKEIYNTILCSNPKCITNIEKAPTKFSIIRESPIKVRCKYCERAMEEGEIKIL